ncbi:MAG: CRTAC1 family protein [Phycisphaerales bacterium]|nr:CRTAC1 family protein [Phycisphaerales bacterium]
MTQWSPTVSPKAPVERVHPRRALLIPEWLRGAICVALITAAGCDKPAAPPPPDNSRYVKADIEQPFAPRGADAPPIPHFTDITAAAGIDFQHSNGAIGKKWMPETLGSGGGFFDYDDDGRPDLLLINSGTWPNATPAGMAAVSRLYRNLGDASFEDITERSGLDRFALYGMGFCSADYDGDADADLFITGVGRSLLLINERGVFEDRTADLMRYAEDARSTDAAPDWSLGATWFDADDDGDLDLFVCNYVNWTPETDVFTTLDGRTKSYATPTVYTGQTNRLFENIGGGRLVEVTTQSGVLNHKGKSMGVIVDDVDNDGQMDLFVTNDTERNLLYLNNRRGRFEEAALTAGCAYDEDGRARAGMGVDSADLCGGEFCIAIGNFSREPLSLYQRIRGETLFVDAAARVKLSRATLPSLTFGVVFFDANLDGALDLALANGHIEPEINRVQSEITFEQSPQLFINQCGTGFFDATVAAGADYSRPMVGRGLACADIDGDGDLDLLFTANAAHPRLLRNDYIAAPATSPADPVPGVNHWLRVRLVGDPPNRDAIGAVIQVRTGEKAQTHRVRTGGSYLSQSEFAATFGLGAASSADVEITWPDGSKHSAHVFANQQHTIHAPAQR